MVATAASKLNATAAEAAADTPAAIDVAAEVDVATSPRQFADVAPVEDDCLLQMYNAKNDHQKLAELMQQGWTLFRACAPRGNCLADSLLELLMHAGLVRRNVDRIEACCANREQLKQTAALHPRDSHGAPSHDAYLEHYLHAGPTILYFVRRYGFLEELPRRGVQVVVHARYDDVVPPDSIIVCEGRSQKIGPPLVFHLYNWTGQGFSGYHYDALISRHDAPLMALTAADGEVQFEFVGTDVSEAMRTGLTVEPRPCDGRVDISLDGNPCIFGAGTLDEDEVVRSSRCRSRSRSSLGRSHQREVADHSSVNSMYA